MQPLFSIITITYNASSTLPATLKSVKEQTCKLYEYIVVDGKSSDNTVELAKNADIDNCKIVSERDRGLYDAMNKGLGMANGDYVIFLNAGDSFHSPETLEHFADAIMENDYPGIVYGQTDIVDSNRKRLRARHLTAPENLVLESFSNGMVVCHQAFVVLRKLTNNFNVKFKYSADYEWCIRCLQRSHRNCYIDEVVIDYLSEGVTTQHHFASLLERFSIMSHYYGFFPTLYQHIKKVLRAVIKKVTS
ncbi:glycosyltransferase family 2 protein [uncultured Duncaniella sp.]|jgi:glycosyltransferase involved in cell wall biosynthesis|uniref:glycosyltransferase family 2 protein n=1 Tax=uncultured Duncaniella sp. TaxID=2768039 RepID=UPI0026746B4C|nr:glycosyltransferase family 2 protein [uncultured Duncaniella sp.]